ncbi:hypothetical protein R3P38DRAFT_2844642 [Favolaschia claudopus]|uniref:Uncharacterized protein n=1 Tax=Favolaschia claudopus TaxID=2862362 RepID=A0AAW0E279_9AGAR
MAAVTAKRRGLLPDQESSSMFRCVHKSWHSSPSPSPLNLLCEFWGISVSRSLAVASTHRGILMFGLYAHSGYFVSKDLKALESPHLLQKQRQSVNHPPPWRFRFVGTRREEYFDNIVAFINEQMPNLEALEVLIFDTYEPQKWEEEFL